MPLEKAVRIPYSWSFWLMSCSFCLVFVGRLTDCPGVAMMWDEMWGITKKRKYDDFKEAFDRASQVILVIKGNSLKQGIKEVCGLASRRTEEKMMEGEKGCFMGIPARNCSQDVRYNKVACSIAWLRTKQTGGNEVEPCSVIVGRPLIPTSLRHTCQRGARSGYADQDITGGGGELPNRIWNLRIHGGLDWFEANRLFQSLLGLDRSQLAGFQPLPD